MVVVTFLVTKYLIKVPPGRKRTLCSFFAGHEYFASCMFVHHVPMEAEMGVRSSGAGVKD